MRSQINQYRLFGLLLTLSTVLLIVSCDQTPTTLDEEAYLEEAENTTFSVEISSFEYDFLAQQFFFSVNALSPDSLVVLADLTVSGETLASFILNDEGLDGDIQTNDHSYDQNWSLPDSLIPMADSVWTLNIQANSAGVEKLATGNLMPEQPLAPVIVSSSHTDTLFLITDNIVIDTLRIEVQHSQGLDEIRDVSIISIKPDGSYSNGGQPILLHDDGSSVVFFTFNGIDFTSGDQIANDGIYSLVFAFNSDDMTGTYYWTHHSRSWLGIEAEPVQDSLIVVAPAGLLKPTMGTAAEIGVFR